MRIVMRARGILWMIIVHGWVSYCVEAQKVAPCQIEGCGSETGVNPTAIAAELSEHIRLGIAPKVVVSAPKKSAFPGFDVVEADVEENGSKSAISLFASSSGSYLIAGDLYSVSTNQQIVDDVRSEFHSPPTQKLTVEGFGESPLPGLQLVSVSAGQSDIKRGFLYVSANKILITGPLNVIGNQYDGLISEAIGKRTAPSQGSTRAPVVIVIYSDLQCPACAEVHRYILERILPRYPGMIRVVYKDFPLTNAHAWALTAALAARCVYREKPAVYPAFLSDVYAGQTVISRSPSRSLLDIAQRLHVDRRLLSACIDAKEGFDEIQEDILEGASVGVATTPTMFVEGEGFIGMPNEDLLYRRIDAIIASRKNPRHPTRTQ